MGHDTSSPPQEEVALLDVSMPHHPPASDVEMYADTGWYMSYRNHDPLDEEPNHPKPSCQASIITPCDHVVLDVLLRASQQLLKQPRAGLNGHRSAPNDHTGQPPPVCGTPPAYHPSPLIVSVKICHAHRLILYLNFPHRAVIAQTIGDNIPTQCQNEYLDIQTEVQVSIENISDYDYDDNSHSSLDDENTDCHDSDYQYGYPLDPFDLIDHSDLGSSGK